MESEDGKTGKRKAKGRASQCTRTTDVVHGVAAGRVLRLSQRCVARGAIGYHHRL